MSVTWQFPLRNLFSSAILIAGQAYTWSRVLRSGIRWKSLAASNRSLHSIDDRMRGSGAIVSVRNWGVKRGILTQDRSWGRASERSSESCFTQVNTALEEYYTYTRITYIACETFWINSLFTLKTTSSEVTSNSSSETKEDSFSKLSPRNSSLWTTWTKNFLMNFWHDVTRRKHPRDSAKDSVSRTFSELSLGISRSGQKFSGLRSGEKKIVTDSSGRTLLSSAPPNNFLN